MGRFTTDEDTCEKDEVRPRQITSEGTETHEGQVQEGGTATS